MALNNFLTLKQAIENWSERELEPARIPEFIALAEDRIAQDLRVQAMETSQPIRMKGTVDGGTAGGTANAITLTPATAATSYARGDTYKFTAASDNTGTTTVDVSGLGSQTIKRRHGGVKEGLSAGDIIADVDFRLYYDGTDFLLVEQGAVPLPANFAEQRRIYLEGNEKPLDFFTPTVFWGLNAANESRRPELYTIEGDFLIMAPVPETTHTGRLLYYRRFSALSSNTDTNWTLTNARGLYLYGALFEAYTFLEDDAGALKYAALYDQILTRVHDADRKSRYPRGALPTSSQVAVV